jgi:hypothetical protein
MLFRKARAPSTSRSWPVGCLYGFPQPFQVQELHVGPRVDGCDHRFTKRSPHLPVALCTNSERVHQVLGYGQFSEHSLFARSTLYWKPPRCGRYTGDHYPLWASNSNRKDRKDRSPSGRTSPLLLGNQFLATLLLGANLLLLYQKRAVFD